MVIVHKKIALRDKKKKNLGRHRHKIPLQQEFYQTFIKVKTPVSIKLHSS